MKWLPKNDGNDGGKVGLNLLAKGEEWWGESEEKEETIVWFQMRVRFCPNWKKKGGVIREKKKKEEWDQVGKWEW